MRKVISMSALVSGLLALPAFAAVPWEEGVERTPVVSPASEQGGIKELQAMMELGPADVGGMRELNRRMAAEAQEQLSRMVAFDPELGAADPYPPEMRQARMEKAAFLGVTTSPATVTLREQLGLPRGMGLVVDFVLKDSPADQAGLKVHDVLQKLDDQLLVNAEQLTVLVRSKKAGDEVTLTVIRAAKPLELKAKLVEKELPVMEEGMEWRGFRLMPGGALNPGEHPEGMMGEGLGGWQKGPQTKVMLGEDGTTTTTLSDADGQITLKKDKEGNTTIVVKDKAGKEIYSGPYTTQEDKNKVPAEVEAKVSKMQIGDGHLHNGFGNPTISAISGVINRSDGIHNITLSINDKNRSVVVKDVKTGKEIYNGPANTDEDFKKMPADVAEKVKAMEGKVNAK